MKIDNQRKAGIMLTYLSTAISTLLMFIYTPIMLKILGQSEYGLYTLAIATVNYLSILSFGFGSAYVKFFSIYSVADDDNGVASLNGMYLTIFSAISAFVIFLGTILILNIENIYGDNLDILEINRIKIILVVMVINLAISFPLNILNSYITAKQKFVFQKLLGIIISVLMPAVSLIMLFLGFKAIALAFVSLGITLLNAFIRFFYVKYKLNFRVSFKNFNTPLFKRITAFSILIFINILADQINWNLDKALLGMFQGTKAVAVYGVAASLNIYFRNSVIAGYAIFETKMSIAVANMESDEYFTDFVAISARIGFMILFLLLSGFVFFGREFITLYYGGIDYIDAYYIALLLMVPALIPLTLHMSVIIQEAKNKHKYRTLVYSFMAVLNLLLSIPLSMRFGGIGAATATAIAVVIGDLILINIIYQKKVGINILNVLKKLAKMLPAFLPSIFFGIYILLFVKITNIITLLVYIIIYTILYVASLWLFGVNKFEKEFIIKRTKKLL